MNANLNYSNRFVESIILHGRIHADQQFVLESLANYVSELELLESGAATVADLKYAERRRQQKPHFVVFGNSGIPSVIDIGMYDDDEKKKKIPPGSFARLSLTGVMRMEDGMSTYGIRTLIKNMEAVAMHPNVKGIMLSGNSGGGEGISGQELMNAITDVRAMGKPVVVHGVMLGSAAIRGTLSANHIMASGPSSRFGSIGTYVVINKEMVAHYKKNFQEIYSKHSPDKNREWREFLKGNRGPLIESVQKEDLNFMEEVRLMRNLKGDVVNTLRGGMFLAGDSLQRGLVDSIGTQSRALQVLKEISETGRATSVAVGSPNLGSNPSNSVVPVAPSISALNIFQPSKFLQMDLGSFQSQIITLLNSVLGLNLPPTTTGQQLVAQLQTQPALASRLSQINPIINPQSSASPGANPAIAGMQNQLNNLMAMNSQLMQQVISMAQNGNGNGNGNPVSQPVQQTQPVQVQANGGGFVQPMQQVPVQQVQANGGGFGQPPVQQVQPIQVQPIQTQANGGGYVQQVPVQQQASGGGFVQQVPVQQAQLIQQQVQANGGGYGQPIQQQAGVPVLSVNATGQIVNQFGQVVGIAARQAGGAIDHNALQQQISALQNQVAASRINNQADPGFAVLQNVPTTIQQYQSQQQVEQGGIGFDFVNMDRQGNLVNPQQAGGYNSAQVIR